MNPCDSSKKSKKRKNRKVGQVQSSLNQQDKVQVYKQSFAVGSPVNVSGASLNEKEQTITPISSDLNIPNVDVPTLTCNSDLTRNSPEESVKIKELENLMDSDSANGPLHNFSKGPNPFLGSEKCLLCRRKRMHFDDPDKKPTEFSLEINQLSLWVCPECRNTVEEEERQSLKATQFVEEPSVQSDINKISFSEALNIQSSSRKNEATCTCISCTERRQVEAEHRKETQELQQIWMQVRQAVRQIYVDSRPSTDSKINKNENNSVASDEMEPDRMKEYIQRLCARDAHQLFQRLESQGREYIIEMKVHFLKQLATGSNSISGARLFVGSLLSEYEALCGAACQISSFIKILEEKHLKRFNLTWELHNKHLFHSIIFTDPLILNSLPLLIKQLRTEPIVRDDPNPNILHKYLKFDDEMSVVSVVWRDCHQLIEKYNDEQAAIRAKQKMLKEDWEFFKQQRKLIEQSFIDSQQIPTSTAHSLEQKFNETLHNILQGNKPSSSEDCQCPTCNHKRCPCDECTISHMITCGIITPPESIVGHSYGHCSSSYSHSSLYPTSTFSSHSNLPVTCAASSVNRESRSPTDSSTELDEDVRLESPALLQSMPPPIAANVFALDPTRYIIDVTPPSMSSSIGSSSGSSSPITVPPEQLVLPFDDNDDTFELANSELPDEDKFLSHVARESDESINECFGAPPEYIDDEPQDINDNDDLMNNEDDDEDKSLCNESIATSQELASLANQQWYYNTEAGQFTSVPPPSLTEEQFRQHASSAADVALINSLHRLARVNPVPPPEFADPTHSVDPASIAAGALAATCKCSHCVNQAHVSPQMTSDFDNNNQSEVPSTTQCQCHVCLQQNSKAHLSSATAAVSVSVHQSHCSTSSPAISTGSPYHSLHLYPHIHNVASAPLSPHIISLSIAGVVPTTSASPLVRCSVANSSHLHSTLQPQLYELHQTQNGASGAILCSASSLLPSSPALQYGNMHQTSSPADPVAAAQLINAISLQRQGLSFNLDIADSHEALHEHIYHAYGDWDNKSYGELSATEVASRAALGLDQVYSYGAGSLPNSMGLHYSTNGTPSHYQTSLAQKSPNNTEDMSREAAHYMAALSLSSSVHTASPNRVIPITDFNRQVKPINRTQFSQAVVSSTINYNQLPAASLPAPLVTSCSLSGLSPAAALATSPFPDAATIAMYGGTKIPAHYLQGIHPNSLLGALNAVSLANNQSQLTASTNSTLSPQTSTTCVKIAQHAQTNAANGLTPLSSPISSLPATDISTLNKNSLQHSKPLPPPDSPAKKARSTHQSDNNSILNTSCIHQPPLPPPHTPSAKNPSSVFNKLQTKPEDCGEADTSLNQVPPKDKKKQRPLVCPKIDNLRRSHCMESNCSVHHDRFDGQQYDGADSDDSSSEESSTSTANQKDGKYCDCCYCEFFGHQNPPVAPTSRNYAEMRDKLRLRLKKKQSETKMSGKDSNSNLMPVISAADKKGLESLDELIKFINGSENVNSENQTSAKVRTSKAAKRARQKQRKAEEKCKKQEFKSDELDSQENHATNKNEKTNNESSDFNANCKSLPDVTQIKTELSKHQASKELSSLLNNGSLNGLQKVSSAQALFNNIICTKGLDGCQRSTQLKPKTKPSVLISHKNSSPTVIRDPNNSSKIILDFTKKQSIESYVNELNMRHKLGSLQDYNKKGAASSTSNSSEHSTSNKEKQHPSQGHSQIDPSAILKWNTPRTPYVKTDKSSDTAHSNKSLLKNQPEKRSLIVNQSSTVSSQSNTAAASPVKPLVTSQANKRTTCQHNTSKFGTANNLNKSHIHNSVINNLTNGTEKHQKLSSKQTSKPIATTTSNNTQITSNKLAQQSQQTKKKPQKFETLPDVVPPESKQSISELTINTTFSSVSKPVLTNGIVGNNNYTSNHYKGLSICSSATSKNSNLKSHQNDSITSANQLNGAVPSNLKSIESKQNSTEKPRSSSALNNHISVTKANKTNLESSIPACQIQPLTPMKSKRSKKKNKTNIGGSSVDDVFMPKDTQNGDMDENEREIEEFKRFCMDSTPLVKKERIPINVNLKDIFSKKKSGLGQA